MKYKIPIEKLEISGGGLHLLIQVRLKNMENISLIIDTGASKTVLDNDIAQKCIEKIRDPQITEISSGINSTINDNKIGDVNYLIIGDLIIENFEIGIMDLEHIRNIYLENFNKNISGLLGSDILNKYNAEIQYNQSVLILYSDKHR